MNGNTDFQPAPWGVCISLILLMFGLVVCILACGFLGSKGDEPRGDASLPVSGIGPIIKEDQDCDADFIQSVVMDAGDPSVYWGEPWLMHAEGLRFHLFFEARTFWSTSIYYQCLEIDHAPDGYCRSRIVRFLSLDGEYTDRPSPVMVLKDAGAPSVLYEDSVFKIWYERPGRGEIGYAELCIDEQKGFRELTRIEPVVQPSESWEVGFVGSPSVLYNRMLNRYEMWYEGNLNGQRSIGSAVSDDGMVWIKRDGRGRNSKDHPGSVAPVLTPDQTTWEFHYPTVADSGSVGMPHVMLHRTPVRLLYYLYYTGNLRGRLVLNLDDVDTSIGVAGSEDGVHWVKASTIQEFGNIAWEVNPIVNEVFPLDVVNKLFAELMGEGYKYMIKGSSNVFFPFVIVDEAAPCMVDMGTFFYLMFEHAGGLDQSKGLALGVIERKH